MTAKSRRQQIEEMLADVPNDPELRYFLAMEYVSAKDDAGAARQFRDLFAVAPDYVPAYLQAGQAFMRLGHIDDARATLGQGIEAARRKGDHHALGEMQGFLDSLE
jgi:Tfp pilus assembly protein PilF